MADIQVSSTSEEGFLTTSEIGEWFVTIDSAGEGGPTPNQVLVADYAACYLAAFRVSARQAGVDDLGRVSFEAAGTLDGDGDLASIAFDIEVEASLGDGVAEIVAGADELCHVRAALREGLHADVSVIDGAS